MSFCLFLQFAGRATVVDHHGADWAPPSSKVSGEHVNIGTFILHTDVTLTITTFNGQTSSDTGHLIVRARNIITEPGSTINGSGSGYPGGGGGGGAGGGDQINGGTPGLGGTAGKGTRGSASGVVGEDGGNFLGGNGGAGAQGTGRTAALRGVGGKRGLPNSSLTDPAGDGQSGGDGGYAASASTGLSSGIADNVDVWMGSGGGGGGA